MHAAGSVTPVDYDLDRRLQSPVYRARISDITIQDSLGFIEAEMPWDAVNCMPTRPVACDSKHVDQDTGDHEQHSGGGNGELPKNGGDHAGGARGGGGGDGDGGRCSSGNGNSSGDGAAGSGDDQDKNDKDARGNKLSNAEHIKKSKKKAKNKKLLEEIAALQQREEQLRARLQSNAAEPDSDNDDSTTDIVRLAVDSSVATDTGSMVDPTFDLDAFGLSDFYLLMMNLTTKGHVLAST